MNRVIVFHKASPIFFSKSMKYLYELVDNTEKEDNLCIF